MTDIKPYVYPIQGDREIDINNDIWKPNSSTKILPSRGFATKEPKHYMYTETNTSNPQGYVYYEKKAHTDLVPQIPNETGECILQNILWDNYGKDRPQDKTNGFENLRQVVHFLESGRSYKRKSADAQGNSWTPWVDTVQSSFSTKDEILNAIKEEIKLWNNQRP